MVALVTYREAARTLGLRPDTIGDLVRSLGIERRRHPANGKALALTADDMRALRRAIDAGRRALARTA